MNQLKQLKAYFQLHTKWVSGLKHPITNKPISKRNWLNLQRKTKRRNNTRPTNNRQSVIDNDSISINQQNLEFMDLLLNPMGQGEEDSGANRRPALIPDSNLDSATMFSVSFEGTFSGGTGTTGVVSFSSVDDATLLMSVDYGGDSMDPTSAPTAHAAILGRQNTTWAAVMTDASKLRYVSAAIVVNAVSSPDDTSGVLDGCHSHDRVRTAITTWQTYGTFMQNEIHDDYKTGEGITVRSAFVHRPFFVIGTDNCYSDQMDKNIQLPIVRFSGLSATTELRISGVMHFEVIVDSDTTLFPVLYRSFNRDLEAIVHECNTQPFTASGSSFFDVMKRFAKGMQTTYRFITKMAGPASKMAALLGLI